MRHQRGLGIQRGKGPFLRIHSLFLTIPFAVLGPLLPSAFLCAVVGETPVSRGLPAMGSPATKGTTQILTIGVAGMGEEEDMAMSAAFQAWP